LESRLTKKVLARYHKRSINAVNRGLVKTSMQEREILWEAELRGLPPEEIVAEYVRLTPLSRIQKPEDVGYH
jgi:meso-butanediol dehydrogenase/(S,S)-butanediol dehydrogenase/diacetyl reductase